MMTIADIPLVHAVDQATQSNYHAVASTHLDIEWEVNWDQRILTGAVTHTFLAKQDNVVSRHQFNYQTTIESLG